MPDYDASEWKAQKGKVSIPTQERHLVEIQISCTHEIQLLGVREKEKVPLKIGREFRARIKTRGFTALVLQGPAAVTFGYRVKEMPRQDGEPLNAENPPAPPMPGANNLVAQMRRMMQAEFSRNRPPTLDPEDLPFQRRYEVDDDDFRFEEDLIETSSDPQPAVPTAEPTASDPKPQSPPAAPEALTGDDAPPSPTRIAAE